MTNVLFFARAREIAGAKSRVIDGVTVADVLRAAGEEFGDEFNELLGTCTVMVDDEVVHRSLHASHPAGHELAVLPPVSGGSCDHDRPGPGKRLRVAVLTISDRASVGTYEDRTGPAVEAALTESLDAEVVTRRLLADDKDQIIGTLVEWCDAGSIDLILTNGGTGLSPRDVTPEATREVLDVEAPGIAELMRSAGLASTPLAALSRQVTGRRHNTVIVNLPGSTKGAVESLEAVTAILPHACAMARAEVW